MWQPKIRNRRRRVMGTHFNKKKGLETRKPPPLPHKKKVLKSERKINEVNYGWERHF